MKERDSLVYRHPLAPSGDCIQFGEFHPLPAFFIVVIDYVTFFKNEGLWECVSDELDGIVKQLGVFISLLFCGPGGVVFGPRLAKCLK